MKTLAAGLMSLFGGKGPARRARVSPEGAIETVLFREGWTPLAARHGATLRVLLVSDRAPLAPFLSGASRPALLKAFQRGELTRLQVRKLRPAGGGRAIDAPALLSWLAAHPAKAEELIYRFPQPADREAPPAGDLSARLSLHGDPWFATFSRASNRPAADGRRRPEASQPCDALADDAEAVAAPGLGAAEIRLFKAIARRLAKPGWTPLFVRRGDALILLLAHRDAPQVRLLSGGDPSDLLRQAARGALRTLLVLRLHPDGRLDAPVDRSKGLSLARRHPGAVDELAVELGPRQIPDLDREGPFNAVYFDYLESIARWPALIDFFHAGYAEVRHQMSPQVPAFKPPFKEPATLPAYARARPGRRSVVFLHNAYYHFNILAEALRRRGWEALTVSLESPASPQRQFMQGEDLNLFDPDPAVMDDRVRAFFRTAGERFGVLHFTGQGMATFFQANIEASAEPVAIPWDMMELRRQGVLIGFTPSGCLDGPRQSSIRALSGGVCGRCVWELRPDVCSDAKNGAWARKLESICDWVSVDGDWAADERTGDRAVRAPVITALDSQLWRPDIEPPEDLRVSRAPGEILIYHAVGNYETRRANGRDIKGTGAVMAAIDRLKVEGFPVRLIFATDIPSDRVRFLQVQADIVVDQLNYGRHGANAREAFMLGKPVVTRREPRQGAPLSPLRYMEESPAVDADEASVYDVLRRLIQQPERWAALGAAGRAFALKWHDADACAERFERIIDRVAQGLPAEAEEIFA